VKVIETHVRTILLSIATCAGCSTSGNIRCGSFSDLRSTHQSRHATLTGGTANFLRTTGLDAEVEEGMTTAVDEADSMVMAAVGRGESTRGVGVKVAVKELQTRQVEPRCGSYISCDRRTVDTHSSPVTDDSFGKVLGTQLTTKTLNSSVAPPARLLPPYSAPTPPRDNDPFSSNTTLGNP